MRSAVLLAPFEINHTLMFHLAPAGGPPPRAFWIGNVGVWLLVGVFLASVVVSPIRQSLHDRIAGTVVRG